MNDPDRQVEDQVKTDCDWCGRPLTARCYQHTGEVLCHRCHLEATYLEDEDRERR
jgi:uncharacterized Zn finger protein (UPF0148 family)